MVAIPDLLATDRGAATARWIAPILLIVAIVFGGSSSGGALVNALLQIAAIAIIGWCIDQGAFSDSATSSLTPVYLTAAVAVWLTVTLLPLPVGIWQSLSGHAALLSAFNLIGGDVAALPLSLTPGATAAMIVALAPPLAMFAVVRLSSLDTRRLLLIVLIALTLVSIVVGIWQQASGYDSDAYFYTNTSRGGAVGFFANRNHLATLSLIAIPFATALALTADTRRGEGGGGRHVLAWAAIALLVLGTLVVQSLAGLLILLPTLAACAAMVLWQRGSRRMLRWAASGGFGVTLAAILTAVLLVPKMGVIEGEASPVERRTIIALTAKAAADAMPFGSGAGSFTAVYPSYEDSARVYHTYVNHAHDDYVEVALELGIPGLLLLGFFLLWFGVSAVAAWRSNNPIAQAAAVAIAVILAHELVDYPVRTAAIACVGALCCVLLMDNAPISVRRRSRRGSRSHWSAGRAGADTRTIQL